METDNYFIYSKTEFDGFLIIPFLWVVSVFFFDKKALKVKFIVKVLCVFLVSVIVFFVVLGFTSDVLVFSKNGINLYSEFMDEWTFTINIKCKINLDFASHKNILQRWEKYILKSGYTPNEIVAEFNDETVVLKSRGCAI